MLIRTYVKRLRMEAPLRHLEVPSLPAGVALVPWRPDLLETHAEVKWLGFQNTIDATIFPNLGCYDGCLRLMHAIAGHAGFVPGATWLASGPEGYSGCVQGVRNGKRTGMIQNLAVLDGHRGHGLGRALLAAAMIGFKDAGLRLAQLEVCASNTVAVQLYHSAGFVMRKTLYREVQEEFKEYAI